MDEIVGKILLAVGKFMPEMHLFIVLGNYLPKKQSKERTHKFKETGDSRYNYQNGLDKTCF